MVDFWMSVYTIINVGFFLGVIAAIFMIYLEAAPDVKKRIKWLLSGLFFSGVGAYVIAAVLKLLFRIARPCVGSAFCPSDYSFPSDHASIVFAVAVFLMYYKNDWRYSLFFLASALVVGVSGFMIGVHTMADVIGGALIGSAIGYLVRISHKRILRLVSFM